MRALICGISGQDGTYLAQYLLAKGYEIFGTSRDAQVSSFSGLNALGIRKFVRVESMAMNDFRSVLSALRRTAPDEVYNLAGQTSVGLSFEQPVETLESVAIGTLNLLEAIRFLNKPIRFYNAGSGECYGDTNGIPADESTPFRPCSPYGVAKTAAHWIVANYREAYGLHASTGILFNHESPFRPERFVTKKIISVAARVGSGSRLRLSLGNIHIRRDWGWAPEYVEAMWRMVQQQNAGDFVIATGESHSLEEFVAAAFGHFGLDWRDYTDFSTELMRPTDIASGCGNPAKAHELLGWSARYRMIDIIAAMIEYELKAIGNK